MCRSLVLSSKALQVTYRTGGLRLASPLSQKIKSTAPILNSNYSNRSAVRLQLLCEINYLFWFCLHFWNALFLALFAFSWKNRFSSFSGLDSWRPKSSFAQIYSFQRTDFSSDSVKYAFCGLYLITLSVLSFHVPPTQGGSGKRREDT